MQVPAIGKLQTVFTNRRLRAPFASAMSAKQIERRRTLYGYATGGPGGGEEGEVRPQTAVTTPGQVRPVHLAAGGLLLDSALPALEAVAPLCEAVEAARVVVAHLQDTPQQVSRTMPHSRRYLCETSSVTLNSAQHVHKHRGPRAQGHTRSSSSHTA